MKDKIRVSVVNYLNSKPFIYGLERSSIINEIDLQLDIPSVCADKLLEGKVDIGLVPVAILPELDQPNILSNYCIGADGGVESVLLLSDCPVSQIENVLLDYHSRTSVLLAEILFEKWWKRAPNFIDAKESFERQIGQTTAAIIIGDRALKEKRNFSYAYDLAEEWKKLTGLPCVFACWVSGKKLPDDFIQRFNKALQNGVENKLLVAEKEKSNYPQTDIADYFTNKISYDFDKRKKEALYLFLDFTSRHLEKRAIKMD